MKFGLLGEKLPHTLSPKIHCEYFGLDYGKFELSKDQLKDFFNNKNFCGINVTIPYKETVIPFLDEVDELAKNIGAVNTVVNKNGKLIGYNTDILGLEYGLKSLKIDLFDKTIMILGSGGTSKTAKYLCQKFTNKIYVVSRNGKVNYQNCYDIDADIIINTTPVGMFPLDDNVPIDINRFSNLKGVFDAIYNPLSTKLVSNARLKGIPAMNGLGMLVAQAVYAKDLFLAKDTDESEIDRVLKALTKSLKNILLIGMPSSGKSTVGVELAKKLNREFVDTDAVIVERHGDIPKIFANEGEIAFRSYETEVIKEVVGGFGKVISIGGGGVIKEENREAINRNCLVFWLKRDIDKLSLTGRPLSKDKETLIKMEKEREFYYSSTANFVIDNNGSLSKTLGDIENKYEENFSN